jgi:carboxyl-terminal processing protease
MRTLPHNHQRNVYPLKNVYPCMKTFVVRWKFWMLLVVMGGLALAFTTPTDRYFEIAKNLDLFAAVYKEVNKQYVDEIVPGRLMQTGIDAMLESLDPYTNFIPEDRIEDFRTMNTGQYGGIGAITREIGKRTVVIMLMEGFAAEKGGLKIGDEILKINQVELSRITPQEAGNLMKGEVGEPVSLTVKRYGQDQPIKLDFKREKIKMNNVPYSGMLENDIAYVRLTEFTPEAGKNVRNAFAKLREKNPKGFILDLRGNPGGLLMEAVNVCNVFLPKGKKVVSTKGKIAEQNATYATLENPLDTEIPLVVLVNRGSASASEIVAGTLQDYDRAVIVGERSFGKGLVQVARSLSYNSQAKITTAKYYTASGRCIQVLDYSNRREDGSVVSVADSLKKPFKTENGRTVFDGGGIEPDVVIPHDDVHPVTQSLYARGYLFDFTTAFVSKMKSTPDPKMYSLSADDYNQFVAWMKGKDYAYTLPMDEHLIKVKEEAEREGYYDALKGQLDLVKNRVDESRKNDLMLYKAEISRLLETDIIGRFYLESGTIQVGFKQDQDLKRAGEILTNSLEYSKLLQVDK